MMTQSAYDRNAKTNWRRQCWNELARRISQPATANVIYLPGDQDRDREVAAENGFDPRRMFAVDRDQQCVEHVRSRGGIAVRANMDHVLTSNTAPLHLVHLDLMGGITAAAVDTVMAAVVAGTLQTGGCVLLNLLRGRDCYTNRIRRIVKQKFSGSRLSKVQQRQLCLSSPHDLYKHRGFLMFKMLSAYLEEACTKDATKDKIQVFFHAHAMPESYSYRSGALIYDSLIFTWPFPPRIVTALRRPTIPPAEKRRIAAFKALVSQRLSSMEGKQ